MSDHNNDAQSAARKSVVKLLPCQHGVADDSGTPKHGRRRRRWIPADHGNADVNRAAAKCGNKHYGLSRPTAL